VSTTTRKERARRNVLRHTADDTGGDS
jgi:hypothetical protein